MLVINLVLPLRVSSSYNTLYTTYEPIEVRLLAAHVLYISLYLGDSNIKILIIARD